MAVKSLIVAGMTAVALSAHAGVNVTGAGSSFIFPVLSDWATIYNNQTGNEINYQSIGSGGGLRQLFAKTVDFAASDKPLTQKALAQHQAIQFPMIIGGIVPIVNLPNIANNKLILNGPVLADIYMGEITHWNDPRIAKLNPELKLPDETIITVHRSDGSGTTFNFTNYLSKVSATWKQTVGSDTVVSWPGFGLGAKGNAGVASQVEQMPDSIGYVEYAYAVQNHLDTTRMVNADGKIVRATKQSFAAAAANADWKDAPGFYLILTNQPGAESWPIVATTFVLVPQNPARPAATAASVKFFKWAYANGAQSADNLDYVSIPASVYKLVESKWSVQLPFYH